MQFKCRKLIHPVTCVAMVGAVIFLILLPILVKCSGEGNIRLLQEEIAVALKACSNGNDYNIAKDNSGARQRRASNYNSDSHIDFNPMQEVNEYAHQRRNVTDIIEETDAPNSTSFDYEGFTAGNFVDGALDAAKSQIINKYNDDTDTSSKRKKRNEPLFDKPDTDQCLSQCVFANLQVVDSRGIPRETELWNLVQSSVTSQQSRAALRDQIRACFQELQSEAEDNGCSYSNKLERCLMLRFADRKNDVGNTTEKKSDQ